MSDARFARAIGMLAETFGRKIESTTVRAYALALGDVPIDALERATAEAMRTEERFPVPATLRRLAGASSENVAAKEWERVLEGIRSLSRNQGVTFGPRTNACIRQLGGWPRMCDLGGDDLHVWARREFLELYAANADAEDATPLRGAEDYGLPVANRAPLLPGGAHDAPRLQNWRQTHDDGLGAKEAAE